MPICQGVKVWHIDFATPSGKRIGCSAQTTGRKTAQELHDKLKAESWRQEQLGEKPTRTWDEAAVQWLKEQAHKATLRDDAQHIAYFRVGAAGQGADVPDVPGTEAKDPMDYPRGSEEATETLAETLRRDYLFHLRDGAADVQHPETGVVATRYTTTLCLDSCRSSESAPNHRRAAQR